MLGGRSGKGRRGLLGGLGGLTVVLGGGLVLSGGRFRGEGLITSEVSIIPRGGGLGAGGSEG